MEGGGGGEGGQSGVNNTRYTAGGAAGAQSSYGRYMVNQVNMYGGVLNGQSHVNNGPSGLLQGTWYPNECYNPFEHTLMLGAGGWASASSGSLSFLPPGLNPVTKKGGGAVTKTANTTVRSGCVPVLRRPLFCSAAMLVDLDCGAVQHQGALKTHAPKYLAGSTGENGYTHFSKVHTAPAGSARVSPYSANTELR